MASIKLQNIVKTYEDGVTVIDGLCLDIKDKEFIILVGPSGCGKSTTLRMIAGLEDITKGDLFIGGRRMNEVAPKDRDIAMVFQSYALYPHMSVYKNMAFALELRHTDKKEIERRVKEAAKILNIEQYLDRKPRALSGGQRQRVALGRAMVRDPAVFLLDEPLSNLDAKLRTEMRSQLTRLHDRLQTTFVYVTHDQTEAMTMADRIVVMKDGVIHQVDTPENLYAHPVNTFVAGFIGTPQMNFIECTLKNDGGKIVLENDGVRLQIDEKFDRSALEKYDGRRVTLGLRPENLHEYDDGENYIDLPLEMSEMTGAETYLYSTLCGAKIIGRVTSGAKYEQNSSVRLSADMGAAHIFDVDTGALICD